MYFLVKDERNTNFDNSYIHQNTQNLLIFAFSETFRGYLPPLPPLWRRLCPTYTWEHTWPFCQPGCASVNIVHADLPQFHLTILASIRKSNVQCLPVQIPKIVRTLLTMHDHLSLINNHVFTKLCQLFLNMPKYSKHGWVYN